MDKLSDFLEDFRNNWDNGYWWIDHQWLATLALLVAMGLYDLAVHYAKLRMTSTMTPS